MNPRNKGVPELDATVHVYPATVLEDLADLVLRLGRKEPIPPSRTFRPDYPSPSKEEGGGVYRCRMDIGVISGESVVSPVKGCHHGRPRSWFVSEVGVRFEGHHKLGVPVKTDESEDII